MAGSVLPQTRAPVGGDTAVLYAKHVCYVHINKLIGNTPSYICYKNIITTFSKKYQNYV